MQKQNDSYRYIKDLVFDIIHRSKGFVDYETVTAEVKKYFPQSKWKKTHWAWYRSHIKHGRFRDEFSDEERANLEQYNKRGGWKKSNQIKGKRLRKENKVKRIGDAILKHVRFVIGEFAGDDVDLRFKLNRWVFARLQGDENKAKGPVKKKLWNKMKNKKCPSCHKKFKTIKGVEIHRKDQTRGYSVENCILLCRTCHQKLE